MLTTKLNQFTVSFPNSQEYHQLKREIFSLHTYYLEDDLKKPYIIDAGAHIGLSTLYFKSLWPDTQILAIEPNPKSLEFLDHNLAQNLIDNVTIERVALATSVGETDFYIDSSDDDWQSTASLHPAAWTNTRPGEPVKVPTQTLGHYLNESVDILKMDIEGVEEKVLLSAGEKIRQVKHLFVEFHGRPDNSLPPIVEFLQENGFAVDVWKDQKSIQPTKVVGLAIIEARQKQSGS